MKRFLYCIGVILCVVGGAIGCARMPATGFLTPESVAIDPDSGARYVSNVSEKESSPQGNGFITKITPNGAVIIQKFIGSRSSEPELRAPKGLWVTHDLIYVADLDSVKIYNKETGKYIRSIELLTLGAKQVDDLAMDVSGNLYVSDLLMNRIYKIVPSEDYRATLFRESPLLGQPNGLIFNPRTKCLIVVTWGTGEILEIGSDGRIHRIKKGLKTLDGVDYDVEGNLYVSSFGSGEIYKIPYYGRGSVSTFLSGLDSPADIACDRQKHELLVPSYYGNSITAYPLHAKNKPGLSDASGPEKNPPDQGENRK